MKKITRLFITARLFTFGHGIKAAKYLKKKNIFHFMGEKCSWHSKKIPSEPDLVSLGNNVHVAANVTFITHDVISDMLWNNARYSSFKIPWKTGRIKINDDVCICSNSIILYDVEIGSNSIIAAGAVVTKNVPSGEIWGGVPAKRIGYVDDFVKKRGVLIENENSNGEQ